MRYFRTATIAAIAGLAAIGLMSWRSLPVVVFGDSVMTFMTEKEFGFPIINQSVGLLITPQIAHVVRNFAQARSFYLTRGVILEGGINDLIQKVDEKETFGHYVQMFDAIPKRVPISLIGITHIDDAAIKRYGITNEQIDRVNRALAQYCARRRKCRVIKLWDVPPPEFVYDGLHPTEAGRDAIGQAVRASMD